MNIIDKTTRNRLSIIYRLINRRYTINQLIKETHLPSTTVYRIMGELKEEKLIRVVDTIVGTTEKIYLATIDNIDINVDYKGVRIMVTERNGVRNLF